MIHKKHTSGRVRQFESSDTQGTFSTDSQGNIKFLTVEPIPVHKDCLFEKPDIDWGNPKKRSKKTSTPSGRVIDGVFGAEGWSKGWEDTRSRGKWKDPNLAQLDPEEAGMRRETVSYVGLGEPVRNALSKACIENLRRADQRLEWTEELSRAIHCDSCELRQRCVSGELESEY